jgi:hypothetical protein
MQDTYGLVARSPATAASSTAGGCSSDGRSEGSKSEESFEGHFCDWRLGREDAGDSRPVLSFFIVK